MTREFKVNNFDLLRLFAACEVLMLHSFLHLNIPYPAFFKVLSNFPGVPMFFTMSGFLISASLERNGNLYAYFKNRVLRIYPALIVCVCLSIPVITIAGGISFINSQTIPWFLAQCVGIIYTPSFLNNYGFGSYNGSLWTIPIELQFYIALPILYAVIAFFTRSEKRKTWLIAIAFLIFSAITFYIKLYMSGSIYTETAFEKVLRYTFIPNIYLFLMGVLLQRLNAHRSNLIHGKGLLWLALYLIICYAIPTSTELYFFQLLLLGIVTISMAYTFPTTSNKLLKGNDISYGVYIYHGLVLSVISQYKLFGDANYVIVIAGITLVLATLSWLFIERPILRMKKNNMHKSPAVSLT